MPSDSINTIDLAVQDATLKWLEALIPIAQRLFILLATIELTWSGIWWAMVSRTDETVLVSMLRKVVTLFFFYTVLLFAPTWMPMIISSFTSAGGVAAGIGTLDPGTIFNQGVQVAWTMLKTTAHNFLADLMPSWLIGPPMIVFLAFVMITAKMLMTLIESYIVLGGGVLLLGFGGSRWTVSFAEGYLLYAVRVGIKLFVIYLLVGLFTTMTNGWYETVQDQFLLLNPIPLFEIMGSSVIFAALVWKVPDFAASMISHQAGNLDRAYAAE